MPRTKEQFEAMRNATREKIQAAAIKLFTQKGFAATNVQDIAEGAGISTGLMYRHYKSKEGLFCELLSEAADGLEKLTKAFQGDESPSDLIQQLTADILDDMRTNDEFAQYMVLITQAFMMEGFLPQIQQLMNQNSALIEQTARLIEKGQQLGQFRQGDPAEMAIYYFSAVQGLADMKFALKERFVTPSAKIVNAFILKEEEND